MYFDLYYIADVPGMGIYFFCYEWVLSKLTLEGERFVKHRCLYACIQCKSFFKKEQLKMSFLLHSKKDIPLPVFLFVAYTPYSRMAAILVFFCLLLK